MVVGFDFSFLWRAAKWLNTSPPTSPFSIAPEQNSDFDLAQIGALAASTLSKKAAATRRRQAAHCGNSQ
jgi:hypothetical protein